ncbi:MAG: hypothetical protein KKA90_01405 [Nanoarchaeota archaeon]|nr:hypothetical protein [Nanoarchaeota archaeon]
MSKKTVYALFSRLNRKHKIHISKFVLDQGAIPSFPTIVEDFYNTKPLTTVETIAERKDAIVRRADEVWVFGEISDDILDDVLLARRLGKKLRYFDGLPNMIAEVSEGDLRPSSE